MKTPSLQKKIKYWYVALTSIGEVSGIKNFYQAFQHQKEPFDTCRRTTKISIYQRLECIGIYDIEHSYYLFEKHQTVSNMIPFFFIFQYEQAALETPRPI